MEASLRLIRTVACAKNGVRNLSKVITPEPENLSCHDFKKVLTQMNMSYVDGFTCLQSQCKLCSLKSVGNLYINKTTGYFTCVKCKSYGEWAALHKLFDSVSSKKKTKKDDLLEMKSTVNGIHPYPKELKLKETLHAVYTKSEEEISTLLQQFNLPCTNKEVLKQLGACVDSSGDSMYIALRTIDDLIAGYRVLSRNSTDETTLLGAEQCGLIILRPETLVPPKPKEVKASTSVVLVTSVADALALVRAGVKRHIICLPYGISMLPIEILPMLESYSKITFWFRNCTGIWDAIRCFSNKLNAKRCFAVKPNSRIPSPFAAYENGENLVAILSEARAIHVEDITSFKSLRHEVMSEMMNIGKVEGVKWRCFPLLNNFLKGFRRGELTVLSGSTGSGKTTLMSQYSLDLAEQGVNTLWGSFEIPNHRLARTLLTQLAGIPLPENMDRFDEFADRLEKLPMYFLKFHGQNSLDKVMKVLEHAQYVYDIGHVIIDTVQFMMGVSEDTCGADRFWRQDNIIAAFRNFATLYNCHVTLVIHPRKERAGDELGLNSVFGGAKATQEADNVLMLQDYREIKGGLHLKILKNRFCGEVGKVPLEFNKASLRFTQQKVFPSESIGNEKHSNSWNKLNVLG